MKFALATALVVLVAAAADLASAGRDCGAIPVHGCHFPFKYRGVTYTGCTDTDHTGPWCAAVVDHHGNYVGDPHYKDCRGHCTHGGGGGGCTHTTNGHRCVFPFIYKHKKYRSCTSVESHRPWCATATTRLGHYVEGQFGYCNNGC